MASQTDILLNMPGPGDAQPIIALPAPQATTPASQIDPTIPVYGTPTTQSVRNNFATAQVEITALMQQTQGAPFLPLSGAHMTGPMYLYNDPTDGRMPVTLDYFNAHGGGGTGGGGIPEAPATTQTFGRNSGAWIPVVALTGGTACKMTGELMLAGNPTDALGAVPKQYVDAIATTANGAVPIAGGTMTGLLILSGDPTAGLGAVTKQYADNNLAAKAPINNPTFTGTVRTGSNLIVTGPSGPAIALYDTAASRPCFGIWNAGGYLSVGMAVAGTGAPSGNAFATMDQTGNFLFATRVNVTGGRLVSSLNANSPSITLNNTSQSNIFGFWNNGSLIWGLADANGAPQSALGSIDNAGNMSLRGGVGALACGNITLGNACYLVFDAGIYLQLNAGYIWSSVGFWVNTTLRVGNQTAQDNGSTWQFSNGISTGNINGQHISCTGLDTNNNAIICSTVTASAGIGCATLTATSDIGFHSAVSTGTGIKYLGGSNYIGLRCPDGVNISFDVNGTWIGNVTPSMSDPRLKSNIAPPTVDALDVISKVTLHQFDLTPPLPEAPMQHWDLGFMSDELADLIPLSVTLATDENPYDTVSPFPLVAYVFAAIQQLLKRIETLEGARQ
jgi:hypothetical protein